MKLTESKKPKAMKLSEKKLRNIIREELERLAESRLEGRTREKIATAVQQALEMLGLDNRFQRNRAGGRDSGEIEYVNRDDTAGFFVNGTKTGSGYDIEIAGRGREYRDSGTTVSLSEALMRRDIQKIADAIEEEPLEARPEPRNPGRGNPPRRY